MSVECEREGGETFRSVLLLLGKEQHISLVTGGEIGILNIADLYTGLVALCDRK